MQDQRNLTEADKELIRLACEHAKARFQKDFISIGGVLRTKSGKLYTAINLKYRVRNLSTCDGLLAVYKALDDGERDFDTFVGVKHFPETDSFEVMNPCGKCRQLFVVHSPMRLIIDNNGVLEVKTDKELLPYAFE